MSVMDTVTRPDDEPPIITICGDAGTGKTSLAATFPKPIFIRAPADIPALHDITAIFDISAEAWEKWQTA